MISVEMEDVLAVLQLCKPYIIGIIAALVIGIVIMIACRRMSRDKRFLIRGEAAIAMVLAVVVCVNMICFGPMATLIGLATGNGTLSDETNEEAAEVAEEIMEDGIVLLKNESLLPLNETKKLNIFGWESINPAYGGAGSGGINDLYDIVSLNQGLENAGFSINQELVDFYNNYGADNPEMSIQKQSWTLPEPPVDTYSDELIKSAKEYSDVAVVVLSRKAGEGHNDIPMDVRKAAYDNNSDEYDDFPEGEHYLQLSQTERDMVDMVCSNFDNVIVIYNGANQFELGFADEYPQIKSVVWCPGTGNVGFNALGKVFSGEVNPSGKTPDTFIYDMTTAPWWNNAEKTEYTNLADMAVEGMNAGTAQVYAPAFTNYVEGIYVGYKYYETAAQEGAIDYDKTVQYPFGYGLSYTEFEQKMGELEEKDGQIPLMIGNEVRAYHSATGRYQTVKTLKSAGEPITIMLTDYTAWQEAQEEADGGQVDQEPYQISVTGYAAKLVESGPMNLFAGDMGLGMVVSKSQLASILGEKLESCLPRGCVYLKTANHQKVAEELNKLIETVDTEEYLYVNDAAQELRGMKSMLMTVDIFAYGFIALISLIAAANVFNTISTGFLLRRREFAVLSSVGMTPKEMNRMLSYECVLYGLKALLYGLPVSLLVTWAIYRVVGSGMDTEFYVPAASIVVVIASVFLVVFSTMLYAKSKLRKANIIDSIRQESL